MKIVSIPAFAQGDTRVLRITIKDDDDVAVDIAGADIKLWIAESVQGPALIEKSNGSGITITDATSGQFEVTLESADTENLEGKYYFECEITDALGNISTPIKGTMKIVRALIKP